MNRKRTFDIVISFAISVAILTGCTSRRDTDVKNNNITNVSKNNEEISSKASTQNNNPAKNNPAVQNNSQSTVGKSVKKQAPPPEIKKVPASSAPVSKIAVKPTNVPVPVSTPAVQVASTDALYNLVETYAGQAKDLVITFGGSIEKDGIMDRVMKDIEDSEYSGYISGIDYSLDDSKAYIHFNYKEGKDNFLSQINIVNSKVQQIVSQVIKPGMSPFEKEVALHDYVVNNTKYDYNNLISNTVPDASFTAYGVFIKGTAVCQGYAEAIFRLLNQAGIKTLIITGKGNGVSHAWNLVNIGGAYYHLDATFDDLVSASGSLLTYNYFNVNDAQISKDHTWNTAQYPVCTSNNYNYFVFNNLVAYNKTDFYNIVKRQLLSRAAIIRCKTGTYDTNVYTPNIVAEILRDNPSINYVDLTNGYSYSYDQNSMVMEFHINYK